MQNGENERTAKEVLLVWVPVYWLENIGNCNGTIFNVLWSVPTFSELLITEGLLVACGLLSPGLTAPHHTEGSVLSGQHTEPQTTYSTYPPSCSESRKVSRISFCLTSRIHLLAGVLNNKLFFWKKQFLHWIIINVSYIYCQSWPESCSHIYILNWQNWKKKPKNKEWNRETG